MSVGADAARQRLTPIGWPGRRRSMRIRPTALRASPTCDRPARIGGAAGPGPGVHEGALAYTRTRSEQPERQPDPQRKDERIHPNTGTSITGNITAGREAAVMTGTFEPSLPIRSARR